jgi:glycosyltransferase involved in cell wall biosynthesis
MRKKMKVVFTVHQFLPEYSAGTEILTYESAREFQARGHDVRVFTGFPAVKPLKDDERFDHYVFDGIQVDRFIHDYVSMGGQSNIQELEYNNQLFGSYFRSYLIREKPDLVHFFHLARLSASAVDICRELGSPMVFTPTDFWFICPTAQLRLPDNRPCLGPDKNSLNCFHHIISVHQPPRIQWWLQRLPDWLLGLLLQLIKMGVNFDGTYTPWLRAFVRRAGFLRKRINQVDRVALPTQLMGRLLIANGLNTERTFPLPFGLNLAYVPVAKVKLDDTLRLGYIGTLAEYKGVHVLLEAVKHLAGKPIELKIYGKLDDYPEYVETLKKISYDDSRVEFCGTFPNSQIGTIFSNLDALVVPSLWYENSPLVIYSAQNAMCPVIASNMAGMSEVIEHGKNGLLFETGNATQLAMSIESLLNDRDLLKNLSDNAKQPLSIQEYVDGLLEVYSDLVGRKASL